MPIMKSEIQPDILTNVMLIYGLPSTGKTSLATSVFTSDNTWFLDCENGSKYIENINKWKPENFDNPETWDHALSFFKEAAQAGTKQVIIDNAKRFSEFCEKYVCESASKKTLRDFAFGSGEELCRKEVKRVIDFYTSRNIGIVFIAHQKAEYTQIKQKDGSKEQAIKNVPHLPNWFSGLLIPHCDIVLYTYKNGFGDMMIKTKGDELCVCKDRTGFLPDELPNNPVILSKILFTGKEKFVERVRGARSRLVASFDTQAETYLKELGLE